MSETPELYAVRTAGGLVVFHTLEQWVALVKGVDLEAARAHGAPLELETESNPSQEEHP